MRRILLCLSFLLLSIYSAIACDTVSNVTISNITSSGSTVNWSASAGASYYEVYFRLLPSGNWISGTSASTSKVLVNLLPNSSYEVAVTSVCGNVPSASTTPVQFNTLNNSNPNPSTCDSVSNVSFSNITTTTAKISWNSVPGATWYNIYRKQLPSGSWILSTTSDSFKNVAGLIPNTTYAVRVQTACNNNTSANLSEFSFTTDTVAIQPPAFCDSVTAVSFSNITNTQASVNWNAVSGAAYYYVYIRELPAGTWTVSTSSATTKVYNNLTINTAYEVLVKTFCNPDSSSNQNAYSFTTTNVIANPNPCDSVTTVSVSGITSNGASISWNAVPGASFYNIYRKQLPSGSWTLGTETGTTKVLTGLLPNTSYAILIQTACNNDTSTNINQTLFTTDTVAIQPPTVCDSVSTVSFSNISNTQATATWNAISGAAYYVVYIRELPSGTWMQSTAATSSKIFSNLTINTSYEVLVKTICNPDSSANQTTFTFTTTNVIILPATCDSVTWVNVSNINTNSAQITWNAVAGATYYNIYRKQLPSVSWVLSTTSDTTKLLAGLLPNTGYAVLVQTACNNDTSVNTNPSFFITDTVAIQPPSVCDSITTLAFTGITNTEATATWNAVPGAAYYLVYLKQLPAGAWVMSTSTDTTKFFNNLTINSSYALMVKTFCNPDTSANQNVDTFTTTNVIINPTPCDSVLNVTVTGVTDFSAVINWSASANATWYNVRYRKLPSGTWNYLSVTGTSKVITGLTAGSNYAVLVRTYCNNDTSTNNSTTNFTTTNTCLAPANIWADYNASTSSNVVIRWSSAANVDYSVVKFKPTTSSTWTTGTSNSFSKSFSGLDPATSYDVQVANVCSGVLGAYSNTFSFIMNNLPTGLNEVTSSTSVEIYPNPVGEELRIKLGSQSVKGLSVSIIDMSGRVLIKKHHIDTNEAITLNRLQSGIYTVQVVDVNGRIYRSQFVKN